MHSIDGLDHPLPGLGIVPYLIEEQSDDLTLIDTRFTSELPKLKSYIANAGYEMEKIKRIILTHVHPDHTEAANKIKKLTGGRYSPIGLKHHTWRKIQNIKDLQLTRCFRAFCKSLG